VIAYACGSVPEVLQDGVTGRVVDQQAAAIDAARSIDALSRRACRQAFERRFTADKMAHRYVQVYQALRDARTLPAGSPRASADLPI
jgi:glycosyltransferase involved in cell wall biosynthesis